MPRVPFMEGAPSSMHPCPLPPKPSEGMGRTGQGTGTASSAPCGITLRRWKVLFGNTVNLPTGLHSRFRWSAARLAGPSLCWENIGVRPSPSARMEEPSGPLSVEMSPISASMRQGPMNSPENIPITGSSIHKSFNMPCSWRAEIWKRHRPCSGLSRKPLSRPWDVHSISWIRVKSPSIHRQRGRQRKTAGLPFRWACPGRPWRGFPSLPAGPCGCVRFPGGRCGFPSPFLIDNMDEAMGGDVSCPTPLIGKKLIDDEKC